MGAHLRLNVGVQSRRAFKGAGVNDMGEDSQESSKDECDSGNLFLRITAMTFP